MNDTLKKIAMLIPPIKRQHEEIVKLRNTIFQSYEEAARLDEEHKTLFKRFAAGLSQRDDLLRDLENMFDDNITDTWYNECGHERYVCTQPFDRIEVDVWKSVYTCCPDYLRPELYLGKTFDSTLEEMWNSDEAKKLRYSVSKGRFEYCKRRICPMYRQPEAYPNVMLPREEWKRKDKDWRECTVDKLPSKIRLFCDGSCNLQCPSCRDSKLVNSAEENAKISQMLESFIRPALKDCTWLSALASGEFFASKPTLDFFKTLSKAEYPNLKLDILTNGILFTPNNWDKLQNLKGMVDNVSVSIDAAEKETYEKLRLGGKWDVLCNNMEFISSLKASGEISHLKMNFVVQPDNFLQARDFIALGKKWRATVVEFQRYRNFKGLDADALDSSDVFSPKHPHYEEASRLFEECKAETGITVLCNV